MGCPNGSLVNQRKKNQYTFNRSCLCTCHSGCPWEHAHIPLCILTFENQPLPTVWVYVSLDKSDLSIGHLLTPNLHGFLFPHKFALHSDYELVDYSLLLLMDWQQCHIRFFPSEGRKMWSWQVSNSWASWVYSLLAVIISSSSHVGLRADWTPQWLTMGQASTNMLTFVDSSATKYTADSVFSHLRVGNLYLILFWLEILP